MADDFRLMDLANQVVDELNELLDGRRGLLTPDQLREAAGSISSNIAEAYGRKDGPERRQFFRYADGSARETKNRLRASFARRRIAPERYWRIHNRLTVICRMLESLQAHDSS